MYSKRFVYPWCYKRCGNAGALKTHMKTHKKPEPKSGTMLKWIVKRELVKSESKLKPKEAIEMKPIRKQRQLKLRKPAVREPTVVANPDHPRPPRRPRRSKQPPIDVWPPLILTNDHRNIASLTSSISELWKQIFPCWTRKCIRNVTRHLSVWVSGVSKNGSSSTRRTLREWESRNRINRSLPLFLLEVNSRRTSCMLLWPCDQLNTMQVHRIQFFLVVF